MNKVTVVGGGNVGASCALRVAEMEIAAEVVMVDIQEDMTKGKALDMWEAAPVYGFNTRLSGTANYEDTAGSDVVVITAGLARKPGMSRDDLLAKNAAIVGGIAENIAKHSPDTIIINVTNPLDEMTNISLQRSGLAQNKVMGMAGVLDSARFRSFIALELKVAVEDVTAFVLGGHGDTMVPVVDYSSVSGIPLTKLMSAERIEAIVNRTRKAGGEIVGLLKTGSAYYSPGASAAKMVESILKDKGNILPAAAYLTGQYGIDGTFIGVPIKLGRNGVEEIYEIDLDAPSLEVLQSTAAKIKEATAKIS
jgi:malate dehydrogenase